MTSEIRRFVQLAEEALRLKEADPTHAITGLMRVKELMLDSQDLWIDQFIDKSSQVSRSDQESLYYGWYSEAVYTVMHQNRRYGLLWAREKGRWYQPIYDDDRSEILVSDIRYYIDNYYKIFEKEAKRAECERSLMDEEKFFCMPSTLDEELPCEMDLTKFGLDYSPDIICTADLLARDLQMAIYNEEVRLADEAYVRGFIDAEQRRQLLDDCMPFTKNDGADNKEVSHFAIGNSDKEVLEVLKDYNAHMSDYNTTSVEALGMGSQGNCILLNFSVPDIGFNLDDKEKLKKQARELIESMPIDRQTAWRCIPNEGYNLMVTFVGRQSNKIVSVVFTKEELKEML